MTKRFTVIVGRYSLAEALRQHSYNSPEILFTYATDAPKAAARLLAEMINGKTRRARLVRARIEAGFGGKFIINDNGNAPNSPIVYSLVNFRRFILATN